MDEERAGVFDYLCVIVQGDAGGQEGEKREESQTRSRETRNPDDDKPRITHSTCLFVRIKNIFN